MTCKRALRCKARGVQSVGARRGFNLIELMIALAITSALLVATMIALDASYTAYQRTTRAASTHNVSRITMDRIQSLIRNGESFDPRPADPNDSIVESDYLDIYLPPNDAGVERAMRVEWVENEEALYVRTLNPANGNVIDSFLLLEGVIPQYDNGGERIKPFTLEYHLGHALLRTLINIMIVPDDNLDVDIDGDDVYVIHLVGTAVPRRVAYD
jgi:prepilin-type N-terminal cleavage/methylation domain-containing protein